MVSSNLLFEYGRGIISRGAAIIAILAVTSCSSVNYEAPITTLGETIDDTVETISELDRRMTAAKNDQLYAKLLAEEGILEVPDDSCDQAASTCSLEVITFDYTEDTFPVTTVMPKAQVGLAGLQRYTENLRAIVLADTAKKVTDSANAALASVAGVESELNRAQGQTGKVSQISQYSQPVGQLISWLFNIYVERIKVSALRKATSDANGTIQELAAFYDGIGYAATQEAVGSAAMKFSAAQEAFDEKSEEGTLEKKDIDKFVKATQAYNLALNAQAARPLASFAEAHMKLTQQLNNKGDVSIFDVLTIIEEVKSQTDTFKKILDAFEDVSEEGN